MPGKDKPKSCFVIAPIGDEGSDTRKRADNILDFVIAPAADNCGYATVVRADHISKPGMITFDIVEHLLDDDLVVADLTGANANVFYELAVRHAVRRPVVQIIEAGQNPPFDVSQSRTIKLDHLDVRSFEECKVALEKQIREAENAPDSGDNPISQAIDLRSLRQSGNPVERSNAEILVLLQGLFSEVAEVKDMLRLAQYTTPPVYPSPVADAFSPTLAATLARVVSEMRGAADPTSPLGPQNWEDATGPVGAPESMVRRGAVGPQGPVDPPSDSLRGTASRVFSKLAGDAPPSGAFPSDSPAEAKKPRKAKGKDPEEA